MDVGLPAASFLTAGDKAWRGVPSPQSTKTLSKLHAMGVVLITPGPDWAKVTLGLDP